MKIKSLGYIGVEVERPREWLEFATEVVGAMPARAVPGESWPMAGQEGAVPASGGTGVAEDGSVYIKLDDWQWRVAAHPGIGGTRLGYLGLEIHDQAALEQCETRLSAAGYQARMGTREEAAARSVTALLHTEDPAGNPIELFHGPIMDFNFHSPSEGTRFVAGSLGLGHVNLFARKMDACLDFYIRVLGFQLTDYIRFGDQASVQFLRCNSRHHSIALVGDMGLDGVHHLLFEVESIDQVGRALDRAMKRAVTITSTLGRHRNDHMLSFYMSSPLGFDVEIGCEGMLVPEDWTAREFCEGDIWGHHGLTAEAIEEMAGTMKGESGDARGRTGHE